MESASASHTAPASLGPAQLRRLGDYLEKKCLELTRGVRKRNEPDAMYGTLAAYVAAASSLVNMVLLIPPEESSASIRASWLLRVTGDIFEDVPAYGLGSQTAVAPDLASDGEEEAHPPQPILTDEGLATLDQVFHLFEKLDEGWCAVIRSERWDPALNHGIFVPPATPGDPAQDSIPGSGALSVTDRIRLRSMILSGKDDFDDWLAEQGGTNNFEVSERSIRVMDHTLREIARDIPMSVPPESDAIIDPEESDSDSM